jgi:hypothetical protein
MTIVRESDVAHLLAHREAMLKFLEEQDARTGFAFDPTATPEKARASIRACGVRPEENLFSRDIIQAKYPEADE